MQQHELHAASGSLKGKKKLAVRSGGASVKTPLSSSETPELEDKGGTG